ncbi:Immediate early response 3-interacting protein 1 [Fusarium oxysporum f. sp. cubense race 1]|uniref:Immediate early response 3-interacting protein 1 n=1 Tax=Fusarium oxysporum f. sp. cubense (strain race 1) TaxID=1229664 RepID=N4TSU0_FUSC1|nr:Immediate early response 3-interacting protein 1 [Fusarium oxysporum f. sp. cubense race 1]
MWFFGSFLYGNNPPILLIQSAAANIDFINLSPASYDPAFGAGPDASVKAKIINLIASVRTIMRMPLIFVNSVIILYELILG